MGKRFTECEKWKDLWFRRLSPKYKLIWFYLLENCDNAGIFEADWDLIGFHIGDHVDEIEFNQYLKEKVTKIKSDIFIINKFINIQYGSLNPYNAAHREVLRCLRKHNLVSFDVEEREVKGKKYQNYVNINATAFSVPLSGAISGPLSGPKDKDKDKDKDKEKDKEKEKEKEKEEEKKTDKKIKEEVDEISKSSHLSVIKHDNSTGPTPTLIMQRYNEITKESGLPAIKVLTKKRTEACLKLTKTYLKTIEEWEEYFRTACGLPFLTGDSKRGWKADIDFLLKECNMVKISEGSYANNEKKMPVSKNEEIARALGLVK